MPGDEQKSRNRPKNHARSAIISSTMSLKTTISRTTTRRGISKIPKCFSILKNCTKQSTVIRLKPSQDQAMADPTANLRQLADHEADKDK